MSHVSLPLHQSHTSVDLAEGVKAEFAVGIAVPPAIDAEGTSISGAAERGTRVAHGSRFSIRPWGAGRALLDGASATCAPNPHFSPDAVARCRRSCPGKEETPIRPELCFLHSEDRIGGSDAVQGQTFRTYRAAAGGW